MGASRSEGGTAGEDEREGEEEELAAMAASEEASEEGEGEDATIQANIVSPSRRVAMVRPSVSSTTGVRNNTAANEVNMWNTTGSTASRFIDCLMKKL